MSSIVVNIVFALTGQCVPCFIPTVTEASNCNDNKTRRSDRKRNSITLLERCHDLYNVNSIAEKTESCCQEEHDVLPIENNSWQHEHVEETSLAGSTINTIAQLAQYLLEMIEICNSKQESETFATHVSENVRSVICNTEREEKQRSVSALSFEFFDFATLAALLPDHILHPYQRILVFTTTPAIANTLAECMLLNNEMNKRNQSNVAACEHVWEREKMSNTTTCSSDEKVASNHNNNVKPNDDADTIALVQNNTAAEANENCNTTVTGSRSNNSNNNNNNNAEECVAAPSEPCTCRECCANLQRALSALELPFKWHHSLFIKEQREIAHIVTIRTAQLHQLYLLLKIKHEAYCPVFTFATRCKNTDNNFKPCNTAELKTNKCYRETPLLLGQYKCDKLQYLTLPSLEQMLQLCDRATLKAVEWLESANMLATHAFTMHNNELRKGNEFDIKEPFCSTAEVFERNEVDREKHNVSCEVMHNYHEDNNNNNSSNNNSSSSSRNRKRNNNNIMSNKSGSDVTSKKMEIETLKVLQDEVERRYNVTRTLIAYITKARLMQKRAFGVVNVICTAENKVKQALQLPSVMSKVETLLRQRLTLIRAATRLLRPLEIIRKELITNMNNVAEENASLLPSDIQSLLLAPLTSLCPTNDPVQCAIQEQRHNHTRIYCNNVLEKALQETNDEYIHHTNTYNDNSNNNNKTNTNKKLCISDHTIDDNNCDSEKSTCFIENDSDGVDVEVEELLASIGAIDVRNTHSLIDRISNTDHEYNTNDHHKSNNNNNSKNDNDVSVIEINHASSILDSMKKHSQEEQQILSSFTTPESTSLLSEQIIAEWS